MKIFILEDHPMTSILYKTILSDKFGNDCKITIATDCEDAYNILVRDNKCISFDLAIIDYNIPAYKIQYLHNGADILTLIKKKNPLCKTLMITAELKKLALYGIIKKMRPTGFVLKSNITNESFLEVVDIVVNGVEYRCEAIQNCVDTIWENEALVDDYNRKIIHYLSKGYKVSDLPNFIPLSESTIKKRISTLKESLGIDKNSSLLNHAINQMLV